MTGLCWLDGRVVAAEAARIDPADRGFTLGDGLFETIAVRCGRPAHLRRHLDRLADGARMLRIPPPYDDAAIGRAIAALLDAARLQQGSVRLTLTRGPAARGVAPPPAPRPTVLITCAPQAPPPAMLRAVICEVTRRNEASPLAGLKTLNYLDSILARAEAAQLGATEAILLNTRGAVAEASAGNLFALIGGTLLTPRVSDGALPGIARALLLERAGAAEATLCPADLVSADALFVTSSLGVVPIATLGGHEFRPAPGVSARLNACLENPA